MKKAVSVLLIAVLILGCMALTACDKYKGMKFMTVEELRASEDEAMQALLSTIKESYDDQYDFWTYDDCLCILTAEASGEIEVPAEHNGKEVVYLTAMDHALDNVTSLTVAQGIQTILGVSGTEEAPSALEKLTLPEGAEVYNSFNFCALTQADVKASLIHDCFGHCDALTQIALPAATDITGFNHCTALTTADLPAATEIKGFDDCAALTAVDLPVASYIDGFDNCTSLTAVSLPAAEEIHGFNNCSKLTTVSDLDELTTIDSSFGRCAALKTLPAVPKLTQIYGSFENCDALNSVEWAADVPVIEYSFTECPMLESVTLNQIETVNYAFSDCAALKTVTLTADKVSITDAFNNLPVLETAAVKGVVDEVTGSFNNCPKLATFTYNGMNSHEESFTECPALKSRIETDAEKEARELKEKLDREPYGPGTSEFDLSADDLTVCYRLVKMNGDTQFKVLLKPGESVTKSFPSGRYTLKVAEGKKWISDKEAFGKDGHYTTTDVYTFEPGYKYTITAGEHSDFDSDDVDGFLE